MVEWLVVVFDKPGADRQPYRSQHIAAIPAAVESGKVTNAGAIYKDVNKDGIPTDFAGSSFNIVADSKHEIIEFLKKDIYYKEGVWDLENVIIHPYGCASRTAKK